MATATANGAAVQSLRLRMPFRGVWYIDATVDADAAGELASAVVVEVGTSRFVGTALRPGADPGGQVTLKVIGGAGRLGETIGPASYGATTVKEVVLAILDLVGERLSPSSDAATLAYPLGRWNRSRGDAASCISAIAKAAGFSWRMLDDGSVWIGSDTFAESTADVELVGSMPDQGVIEVADEGLSVRPGQSFGGSRIYEIEAMLGAKETRSKLTTTEGGGRVARAEAAKFKRQLEGAGFPFARTYAGRVTSQNADGTVEVKIDDGKDVCSQSNVPLRHGLPGVTRLELAPQAEVVLGFDDGDPQKPYAALPLQGGRLLHLTLDADVVEVGGTSAVADAALTDARLRAIETFLAIPGPVIGPAPLPPVPIASSSLFSKPGP